MAKIIQFNNKEANKIKEEFEASMARKDEYLEEYDIIVNRFGMHALNVAKPDEAITHRMIELMGLMAREDRIQRECLEKMGKETDWDVIAECEEEICKNAYQDVYGMSVL